MLTAILLGALSTLSCDGAALDHENVEQVLGTLGIKLSASRVVLTPGGSATVKIALEREDESVPVELKIVGGADYVSAELSETKVTSTPATVTITASGKAEAQELTFTVAAYAEGVETKATVVASVQVPTAPRAGAEAYAPGVVGEPKTLLIDHVEVPVEVVNGLAIQGDMVLGDVNALEAKGLLRTGTCNWGFHTEFSCSPWSGGVIGYMFADNWGTAAENTRMRGLIEDAMDEWELQTGLRFVLRNYGEYLEFRDGDGCSSNVGRAVITGFDSQSISLNNTGCDKGSAMHEIGHALGLYHEQSRNDRDGSVVVDFGRVRDGLLHNFWQWGDALVDRGNYDYDSIMHYGPEAFARNEAACLAGDVAECTIRPLRSPAAIGQRSFLSEGDILGAYALYPPAYRILGATAGATDDRFRLFLDFDTEAPRSDRMRWHSNLVPGELGRGYSLDLQARDVPAGTHVITANLEIEGVVVTTQSLTITVANTAPSVTLAATNGRVDQQLGQYFTIAATVTDPEDGACAPGTCRYTWSPTPHTGSTTSTTATYRFMTVGPRTITVAVEDNGGAVTTASILVNIVNSAPTATIVRPSAAVEVYEGVSVALEGRGTDVNTTSGAIACSALRWSSSNAADTFSPSATGCTPSVAFAGVGTRTISLVATDPQGLASTPDTVGVTVRACGGTCGPTALLDLPDPDWVSSPYAVYFRERTMPIELAIGHSLAPAGNPVAYRLTGRRIGFSTTFVIASGSVAVPSSSTSVSVDVAWPISTHIPAWSGCSSPQYYRDYELVLQATDSAGRVTTRAVTIEVGCDLI